MSEFNRIPIWRDFNYKFEFNRLSLDSDVLLRSFFDSIADVNNGPILALLPPSILTLGITMYILEQVSPSPQTMGNSLNPFLSSSFRCIQAAATLDIYSIFFNTMGLACMIIWPFFFCQAANASTYRMLSIKNTVYDLPWCDFPLESRKHLLVIIAQLQNPAYFTGFGLIRCSLPNFSAVSGAHFWNIQIL